MARKIPLRLRLPLLIISFAVIPAVIIGLFLSSTGQQAVGTVSRGLLDTGRSVIEQSTQELAKLSERMLNQTSDQLIGTGQEGVERVGKELSDIGQKSLRQTSEEIAGAAGESIRGVTRVVINTLRLNLDRLAGNLTSTTKTALSNSIRETVSQRALRLATQVGDQVGSELEALTLTAQISDLRLLDPAKAKITLMALQGRKGLLRLALLDGFGQPIASYGYSAKEAFAGRPEFTIPATQGQQYVSPVMLEEGRKTAYIRTAIPVFLYGKRVAGVLMGDLSLQTLTELTAREQTSGYVFVTDDRGRVIAHSDRQVALQRADLSGLGPVKEGLSGKSGSAEFQDDVWGTMVAGYATVPGRKWVVVVAEKAIMAYKAVTDMQSTIQGALSQTESDIVVLANERAKLTEEALQAPVEAATKKASTVMGQRSRDLTGQIVGEMRNKSRQSLETSLQAMAPKAKEASSQATATMLPQAQSQMEKTNKQFRTVGLAILAICAVVAAGLSFVFLRGIINPIRQLVSGAKTVAEGDLRQRVELASGDELGELSEAFTQMEGNLQDLIAGIKSASTKIVELASLLSQASGEVGQSTEYVAKAMNELAAGATSTAGSVGRTVEETQAMAEKVTETLAAARQAEGAVGESGKAVDDGRKALEGLVSRMTAIATQGEESLKRMESLRKSSTEIGQITEIISSIAEQTNLLALNAAIEAARAGEHGRGFAVVADEVRKLAEQSKQAVQRISGLVGTIQGETDRLVVALEGDAAEIKGGVAAVGGAKGAFEDIARASAAIDGAVRGILSVAANLDQGSRVMASAMEEISSVTQETAASAEEVGANAQQQAASVQQINRLAQELTGLAKDLLARVGQFKLATTEAEPGKGVRS